MNEQDKQAFEKVVCCFPPSLHSELEDMWKSALEYERGKQEPVAKCAWSNEFNSPILCNEGEEDKFDGRLYRHPAPAVAVNEQDRLDAARYQWLRTSGGSFDISVRQEDEEGKYWITTYSPSEFDSAIDTAIAAAEAAKGAA